MCAPELAVAIDQRFDMQSRNPAIDLFEVPLAGFTR
jgi:hypothetical protein